MTRTSAARLFFFALAVTMLSVFGGCSDSSSDDNGAPGSRAGDDAAAATGDDAASGGGQEAGSAAGNDGGPDAAHAPLTTPVTALLPGAGFYPRAIRATDGSVFASIVAPQASGRLGGTILESTDDAVTFHVVGHIDDPVAQGGLCCSTLYQLPHALGALPAGTLLWATSVGGDTPGQPMSLPIFSSVDKARTWKRLGTIATGSVPRSQGGLWEPELSQLDDGALVCHYSDETASATHSQKLVAIRSSDGVAWGQLHDTVALAAQGARPGMANVRRPPGGPYVMTYEICGIANDNCTAHLRTSADGWNWGDANDPGLRPATVDGKHFRHAPTLAWSATPGKNGRFYLMGQMVYDANGQVAAENGSIALANTEGGFQSWFAIPAPVPVNAPYDNFCPNYSSPLLPLDNGVAALEIASRYDGNACRAFFARGPLLGTGDATGVGDGKKYRLASVMSRLCLDVAGGSTTAGGNVQQYTCNGLAPQNWTLARAADGSFSLKAENSGMCLTVQGGGATPGANVDQEPCNGGEAQAWTIKNVGLGYYVLGHRGTGDCLDVAGGSTAPGGNIEQYTCNDLSPQIWHFEPR